MSVFSKNKAKTIQETEKLKFLILKKLSKEGKYIPTYLLTTRLYNPWRVLADHNLARSFTVEHCFIFIVYS